MAWCRPLTFSGIRGHRMVFLSSSPCGILHDDAGGWSEASLQFCLQTSSDRCAMARSWFSAAHARVPEDIHTHDVVPTSFDWRRVFAASPISGGATQPCPCRGSSRQIPPRISDCTRDGCEIVPPRKFFTPDCVSCFDRSSDDCEAVFKQWASCPSSTGLNGVSDTTSQFLVFASLRVSL